MTAGDLLRPDRIFVPLRAETGSEALRLLSEASGEESPDGAARGIQGDDGGAEFRRISERTLLVVRRGGRCAGAALGITPLPTDDGQGPRIFLFIREGSGFRLRDTAVRALAACLSEPSVEGSLLAGQTAEEVKEVSELMDIEVLDGVRVRDALSPLVYRVYPETPLGEVIELIARRELAAVPVVSPGLQVLGVISAGEALRQAVQIRSARREGAGEERSARDVMSRSVLCVTEDQSLEDAAQILANRGLSQLPVVREGEMVGFLTRNAVLEALCGLPRAGLNEESSKP